MKVVLQNHLKGLGHKGQVVDVKQGYFMNYLMPKNLALLATVARISESQTAEQRRLKQREKLKQDASSIVKALGQTQLTFSVRANSTGTLYAIISHRDIIKALKKKIGTTLTEDMFSKHDPIKTIGTHKITLSLTDTDSATFTVVVSPSK